MNRLIFVMRMCFFFVFMLVLSSQVHAQDLLKGKDLSQVRVDQLSDADVLKLKTQLAGSGMTMEQAEKIAVSKGMSPAEFAKLRERLDTVSARKKSNVSTGKLKSEVEENAEPDSAAASKVRPKPLIDSLIFGSELYTSTAPNFQVTGTIATPLNYVLGPGDQISISVYGVQQYNGEPTVSSEGSILIPDVGQIKVGGMTIEAATQKIKNAMGSGVYSYLKSGGAKLSVTLANIRTINVTVIGAYRPGNYTLSSLSTVFLALFASGGPSSFGSFREIELVRNNKVERKVDLYRFLLHGDMSDNIGLKDHDVIRIPPYKTRVELQGQVKRPGIFEVLPGESFSDILSFASGFTDTAYQASVKIFQRNERERQLHDLLSADYGKYIPKTGDVFVASKIMNRFQNRVRIAGAVFRPDVYELVPDLKVADLIRKADGLKEDAYTARGLVLRLEEDLNRSILSFDIKKALAGDVSNNISLKREDEVLISSVLDLRDSFKVTIQGEVRFPGLYDYVDNMMLKDLILQAGGFTDAAYKNIEVARLIKRDSVVVGDNRSSIILNTQVDNDLSKSLSDLKIQPFDVVTIRKKAGYLLPETVLISGMVQYPGPYVLSSNKETVSDVLRRAGGLMPEAYPEGAYLKRYKTAQEKQKIGDLLKQELSDTNNIQYTSLMRSFKREYDQIPLDLIQINKHPGSLEDLILKAQDEIYIPKFDGQVKVSGEVLLATQVAFKQNNSFRDYIDEAGGYSAKAWKQRAYIVYQNGKAATIKRFLFFKKYPKVFPGSEVVIPKKADKKGLSTGEIIGISSALASLAGVVIAILRL